MLAQCSVLVPFVLGVIESEKYSFHPYDDSGYQITMRPPVRIPPSDPRLRANLLRMNGQQAYSSNILSIDFYKDTFDRRAESGFDPPLDLIVRTTNQFLNKLRFATKSSDVKFIDKVHLAVEMRYLNDDRTELTATEGLVRIRSHQYLKETWVALSQEIWDQVHDLPANFNPPVWDRILVDATAELPNFESSITLAATALEVFIASTLNSLAARSDLPPELWKWINERDHWQKEPSVAEKFSILLKLFTGHSLQEDNNLWEIFKHLRDARNSFVHEGIAKIRKRPVTEEMAFHLLEGAGKIIRKIREWLPSELQWPHYERTITIEVETWVPKGGTFTLHSAFPSPISKSIQTDGPPDTSYTADTVPPFSTS